MPPPFPDETVLQVDPAKREKAEMYPFMISTIVPRPVAFVSSISSEGSTNLSPYSYFNVMGHYPPVVAIGQ